MKSNLKQTLVAVLLLTALFACTKNQTGGSELRSSNDIIVNGTGFDGSVHAGTKVLYTLKDIHENQNYTLRAEIGLTSEDGLTFRPDGTLTANIYVSADAFRNDSTAPFRSAVPAIIGSNIYEVNFSAESTGDYVVVLSGDSSSVPGIQFFSNLRLMSADPTANPPVLSSFTTATIPASAEQLVNPLNPGYLNIYNGGAVSSSGTFTISLISNATATIANPQIFVYLDSTLTVSSLMLSSIPTTTQTTTQFVITRFSAGVPDDEHAEHRDDNVITDVTFTSGAEGPFIVLKGFISAVTYTLSIGP